MNVMNQLVVTSIDEVFTVPVPKGRRSEMKNRKNYGISFCETGKITYIHNNREFISDRNHAILLPMNQTYILDCNNGGNFPLINFRCVDDFCCDEFISLEIQNPDSFLKSYQALKELFLFRNNYYQVKSMSILYDIISRLAAINCKSREKDTLTLAIDYIEKNYTNPQLSNTMLAEQSHISEVYFRRRFRQLLGTTPKQYIQDIRIRRAKQMLTESYVSVTDVAERCGFSSVYHFCRSFKMLSGYTPTEYSKQFGNFRL